MSGPSGGESWWWSLWRTLLAAVVAFAGGLAVSFAYLWLRGQVDAVHLAYCLYALGGLVATVYVVAMLGMNSAMGVPGITPPAYAYYPLDKDLTSGYRRRMGEMQQATLLVLVLVTLFWGVGAVVELYL